jgi:hypothetical protein
MMLLDLMARVLLNPIIALSGLFALHGPVLLRNGQGRREDVDLLCWPRRAKFRIAGDEFERV